MIDYKGEITKDLEVAEWLVKRSPKHDTHGSADAPMSYAWHIRLTVPTTDQTVSNAVRVLAGLSFPDAFFRDARLLLETWYEDTWLKTRGYLTEDGDWTERGLAELDPYNEKETP